MLSRVHYTSLRFIIPSCVLCGLKIGIWTEYTNDICKVTCKTCKKMFEKLNGKKETKESK